MGYKQELLQKINNIKAFMKARQENFDQALRVDNVLHVLEDVRHVESFFKYFNSTRNAVEAFGSAAQQEQFIAKNQALFQGNEVPNIRLNEEVNITIPDVDFEAVINAIEESTVLDEAGLEDVYKKASPKIREFNLPMTQIVTAIKADADALFEAPIAKELKESLDFANGEMVEKLGENLVDTAFETNSIVPMIHAVDSFRQYVHDQGLDENAIVNHNGNFRYIDPGFANPENINAFKPFLQMEAHIPEDYQEKVKGLDAIVNEQGLLQEASGGETGFKEYGLMDYFVKQRELKKALTDQAKLVTADEKRENLIRIDRLSKETKEIISRYDKVLDYIKKNFDLENINFPGNVYGGRPDEVKDGNIDNWRPNLPPRYDFENAKAVVFLNGFTQLKAACQWGDVTIEEYLASPGKTYLKAVENIGRKEDAKYYLPRGEENPLGKRLARVLTHSSRAYGIIKGYNLTGGRAMEFMINTSNDKDNLVHNTIVTSIAKEYEILYNRNPDNYFGNQFEPQVENIKNLFALADQEDDLYKLSNSYRDKDGNLVQADRNYEQALKAQGNIPLDQQYQKLMNTLRDFATERKYMSDHIEEFDGPDSQGNPPELSAHSLGIVLAVGRDYFEDLMLANDLSVASIQDDALREEVTSFLIDPVGTLMSKYVKEEDLSTESLAEVKQNYKAVYLGEHQKEGQDFFRKFNQYNQKVNGYNTGKSFTKCLDDNKGSWWERWRGKTSKQYMTLQRIGREAAKSEGNIPGDNRALYSAAKAYKAYKLPEGRTFEQLNSTEKRRIEFCDSIINAYEAQKREAAAEAENNQPQVANDPVQVDFQNQLNQDLAPNNAQPNNDIEAQANPAAEKDPPEDEGVQP